MRFRLACLTDFWGCRATRASKSTSTTRDTPGKPATRRMRRCSAAAAPLFCGSCFKTFVLATYLQEVEAGRLSESEQLPIDDRVRSIGGGVFDQLSGTASARTVLEAMI